MKKTTFIIIPGLWDQRPLFGLFYRGVGKWWGAHGMYTLVCPMHWISLETYRNKLARLEKMIDGQRAQGREVVLVGVSAGGPVALLGLIRFGDKVRGAVTINGLLALAPKDSKDKIYIKTSWYKAARASQKAALKAPARVKERFLAITSAKDDLIETERAMLIGAAHKHIIARGHMSGIIAALVVHPLLIRRFARGLSSRG